jgi:hypothetical protein
MSELGETGVGITYISYMHILSRGGEEKELEWVLEKQDHCEPGFICNWLGKE